MTPEHMTPRDIGALHEARHAGYLYGMGATPTSVSVWSDGSGQTTFPPLDEALMAAIAEQSSREAAATLVACFVAACYVGVEAGVPPEGQDAAIAQRALALWERYTDPEDGYPLAALIDARAQIWAAQWRMQHHKACAGFAAHLAVVGHLEGQSLTAHLHKWFPHCQ